MSTPFTADAVEAIKRHMNDDHADDALIIVRGLGGRPEATTAVTSGSTGGHRVHRRRRRAGQGRVGRDADRARPGADGGRPPLSRRLRMLWASPPGGEH